MAKSMLHRPIFHRLDRQGGQVPGQAISRRHFLRAAGAAAAGLLADACAPIAPPELVEQARAATTALAAATPVGAARSQVAIADATSYERELIRQRVRDVLDAVGGLGDIVSAGDRVAIKVNLTGGCAVKPLPGVSAVDSYVTHPEVVRALGELVLDAGAREIYIVEAAYEWASYVQWGYEEVAEALGATLIDLNDTRPYNDFATTLVGDGWFIYKEFTFNHILEEVDAFISVPKMKCHWSCGVTHSLKNLVGLVPARFYRVDPGHNYRSGFHGTDQEMGTRLPRVIIDLNRARPVDLALIDGIQTTEGGEGPWIETMAPIEPGVLIAGKDPVAADAVATAAMAFDPMATRSQGPFLRSDNHLNIAHEVGLGTNRLDEMEVIGHSIADVRIEFATSGH
jgi:uncharacterized protein (DUF362 family)